ncbi:MAG: hypothetical protein R3Y44_01080 [Rikenellaceae bacterium]
MKKLNIFFAALALIFVASCQKSQYEVCPLAETGVYEITNLGDDAPVRYTLYYELGLLIAWTTDTSIEGQYTITQLLDYSTGDNRAFDCQVEDEDGVCCKYSVDAPYNGATAKGTLTVSRDGEKSVSYSVTVTDETRWTDYYNE